jgi:hypothetical protein
MKINLSIISIALQGPVPAASRPTRALCDERLANSLHLKNRYQLLKNMMSFWEDKY